MCDLGITETQKSSNIPFFVSAICSVADAFLPDTCVACGTRFYTCAGAGQGVESACTGALVWSQNLMSCVPAAICTF